MQKETQPDSLWRQEYLCEFVETRNKMDIGRNYWDIKYLIDAIKVHQFDKPDPDIRILNELEDLQCLLRKFIFYQAVLQKSYLDGDKNIEIYDMMYYIKSKEDEK